MVIVYLKNGEKAPLPDANYVKLDAGPDAAQSRMLRCYRGDMEVGVFKWEDVSGYSVDASYGQQRSSDQAYEACHVANPNS